MRIGIDARFYGPKQKGLGRYVKELVDNLEKIDSVNRYAVFLRRENWEEYVPQNPNFKKILADYGWYGLKEQLFLPWQIHKAKVDLMFFPHFNVPILCFRPFIVTIHDLILKKYPTRRASSLGPLLYYLKNRTYHLVIYSALKRAEKIIAVSQWTKDDILQYFKLKPEKIKVVYEGRPGSRAENSGQSSKLFRKFHISKPYLLYVGNVYPHKNLEKLIQAFEILAWKEKMNLQLVLVGKFDYFYRQLQKKVKHIPDIVFTDYVSDKDLAGLYQGACLYVFPSLYEGFGLPPLEAMAYNLPVVCSSASCLPEILGRAALYFHPENTLEMAQKIKQVLKSRELREKLILKGQEQIKKYSWFKMAQEIKRIIDPQD